MSILIKGIEMPKDDEILCINIKSNGDVYYDLDLSVNTIANAFRIPPHGRLIDADELMKKIFGNSLSGREWSELVLTKDKNELQTALFNLPIVFNNAPTVIPADKENPDGT